MPTISDLLETGAYNLLNGNHNAGQLATVSAAISLKRIADCLAGMQDEINSIAPDMPFGGTVDGLTAADKLVLSSSD